MRHPLLPAALAFLAGDLAGLHLGGGSPLRDAFLALVLCFLLLLAARLRMRALGCVLLPALLAAGAAGFAAGRHACLRDGPRLPPGWQDGPLQVTGTLLRDPVARPFHVSVDLRLEQGLAGGRPHAAEGVARVSLPPDATALDLRAGERLRLWARLRRPRGYGNPGAFDYPGWLRRHGVDLTATCKSLLLVERRGRGDLAAWRRALEAARRGLRGGLLRALPDDARTRGLLQALLLGDRSALDPRLREALTRAGAAHLLAVSGLHVGLAALLLHAAAARLGFGEAGRTLLTLAGVLCYAGLAGGKPPLLRAALVVALLLAGRLLYRGGSRANLLAGALLALLVLDPEAPGDPAFRLSFAAAAGIVCLLPGLEAWLERRAGAAPACLRSLLAAALAAQAATLPETVARFGRTAAGGAVANLLAVPAAAVLVPGAAAISVAGLVAPPIAPLVAQPARWLTAGLQAFCEIAGRASWPVPPPPAWLACAYLAGLCGAAIAPAGRVRRMLLAGFLLCLLLVTLHPWTADAPPAGAMRVTALDVGQGDALLVEADGTAILVDAGGAPGTSSFDVGERVVAPALRRMGLRRIPVFVLTHHDHDHLGGAAAVLSGFEVGALWRPAGDWSDTGWNEVREAAVRRGVPVRVLSAGDTLKAGPLWIETLWPLDPPALPGNDASLVLRVRLGPDGPALLLTGDLEAAGERALLKRGVGEASVLKAGHHGSRTSSSPEFLEAVRPRFALVSAGERNPWGHPDAAVLERLRRGHAQVLRTDRRGALRLLIDSSGRVDVQSEGLR